MTPISEEPLKDLGPAIRAFLEAEMFKVYAYGVKNLRLMVVAFFIFLVLSSAVYFSVCLLVLGLLIHGGASTAEAGTAMVILGVVLLLATVGFLVTAASDKFWIRVFKLNDLIKAAEDSKTKQSGEPRSTATALT